MTERYDCTGGGVPDFLSGGGRMGELIRSVDWSATPLGAPGTWPQTLRVALSICLHSSFPTAIYWGSDLRLIYNDAWSFIPGERHPWALGTPAAEVWTDIWEVVGPQFQSVMSSGEGLSTFDQMLPMVKNDIRHETYWNYSLTPIRANDGSVLGVLNQGHETTSRLLEERRRAAEIDRERRLFQQAPGFITILNGRQHRFEFVNDAYVRLFGDRGYSGKTVRDVFPELEGQGFFEWLDEVFSTGKRFVADGVPAKFAAAPGSPEADRLLDFIYAPVTDDDGIVTGIFCEGHDVTEARRSRDALTESEERFRQLAETIDQVFYVTELDTRQISYLSPSYERLWGRTRHEVVQDISRFFDSIHPEDREYVRGAESDQMAGVARELQYRIVRPDGTVRWIRDRFFPVVAPDGRVHRSVGLAEDITERKELQDALHDLNETLERRVEQRTYELEQAQEALRQSQKLESMGQLTGGVAHDFNNLLSPIIGGLDMLQRRGVGDERAQRQISGALQSAERAKTLVQRLLAFARRQPLQMTAVDLGPLVSGMIDLIDSTSGPRVRVEVDVAPGLPPASADGNQLEMALLNLAVNSRDAMPGGGTLTIAATLEDIDLHHRTRLAPGAYLRLAVSDTGSGMDEATMALAIEPFFSTKGIGQGTGLGLSTVHGLAAQLGGALTIESRVGLGTTVELWLPPASREAEAFHGARAKDVTSGRGSVLLVDDDDLVRASTADMLSEMGYSPVEARSAEEALQILDSGITPDLLITDNLMPGMGGIELVSHVRERVGALPVLVISGYAETAGIPSSLRKLIKPFRMAELSESIRAITSETAKF